MARYREKNYSQRFNELPNDVIYLIAEYLSSKERHSLTQTSVKLRYLLRPLVFSKCQVASKLDKFYVPITYWLIPLEVLYNPSKYSWFPNELLKQLLLDKQHDLQSISKNVKLSDYPRLKSITLPIEFASTNLIITDKDKSFFTESEYNPYFINAFTTECFPLVKFKPRLYSIPTWSQEIKFYALNCNNLEVRSTITSLGLNLSHPNSSSTHSVYTLTKLNTFINLKEISISYSNDYRFDIFEGLVKQLPTVESLQKLTIKYSLDPDKSSYLRFFDNLTGKWKIFNLIIEFDSIILGQVRLPSVTTLQLFNINKIGHDDRPFNFDLKIEAGDNLKKLVTPFQTRENLLSPYNNDQNMLDNLTFLSIYPPTALELSEFREERKVFTKVLPNLKTFEYRNTDSDLGDEVVSMLAENFEEFSSTLRFGEFDILNYESIKVYILKLKRKMLENRMLDENDEDIKDKLSDFNEYHKALKNATPESDIYELYDNFYKLQALSSSYGTEQYDNCYYATMRAIVSVLFIQMIEYVPNLEVLNLFRLTSIEEYPALHRLIKYHKKLKTVSSHVLYEESFGFDITDKDESWKKFNNFYQCYGSTRFNGKIFLKPPEVDDMFLYSRIDVEGFRNYVNPQKLQDPEAKDLDWLTFPGGKKYMLAETLSVYKNCYSFNNDHVHNHEYRYIEDD